VPAAQAWFVHGLPSSHRAALPVQQPGIDVRLHCRVVVLHVLVVQVLVSAQSESRRQQPCIWVCWHWLPVHASVVQTSLSSHAPTLVQQFVIAWLLH